MINCIPDKRKHIFIEIHTLLDTDEYTETGHCFSKSNIMTDLARSISAICTSETDHDCRHELISIASKALSYIEKYDGDEKAEDGRKGYGRKKTSNFQR